MKRKSIFEMSDESPDHKMKPKEEPNIKQVFSILRDYEKTFKKTIPGKLQTYMSSGKPIIASISGESKKIIIKAKCGFVSNAENHKLLKKNIIKFTKLNYNQRKKLGMNGKKFSNKFFSKQKIIKNLENEINLMLN